MTIAPFRLGRDFVSLREAIDRLMEESVLRPPALFDGHGATCAVDLHETPEAYVLKAALPGVKPEDLEINATADTVTIKGEYKSEKEVKETSYLRRERRMGSFERSFTLPVPIEPDRIEATQAEGVLTLTLPKTEKVKPKRVSVTVK